jgi:hypothetical protein
MKELMALAAGLPTTAQFFGPNAAHVPTGEGNQARRRGLD